MGQDFVISVLTAALALVMVLAFSESNMAVRYTVKHRLSRIRGLGGDAENKKKKETLYKKVVIPIAESLIRNVSMLLPVNEKNQKRLQMQLTLAGSRLAPKEYAAISVIIILCCSIGAPLISPLFSLRYPVSLLAAAGAYGGFAVRKFLLSSSITRRREEIESELPNIIDLLAVSTTVGLGFDQAVAYVTEQCGGVFVDELRLAKQQLGMGRSKREALGDMALRCGVDEVSTFVSSILQAEEVGISMKNILSSQAAAIRQAHKQKVEARAAKLPVKILLPIVVFIFPVLFIVLLGPSVPSLMEVL